MPNWEEYYGTYDPDELDEKFHEDCKRASQMEDEAYSQKVEIEQDGIYFYKNRKNDFFWIKDGKEYVQTQDTFKILEDCTNKEILDSLMSQYKKPYPSGDRAFATSSLIENTSYFDSEEYKRAADEYGKIPVIPDEDIPF